MFLLTENKIQQVFGSRHSSVLAKLISGQNKGLSTTESFFTKFQNGGT